MEKSIKLDELFLLRIVAEENHQEVFFGSMLGMGIIIEKNSVLLNSFKNNYFSEYNMDHLQVFNKGSIGALEDYISMDENETFTYRPFCSELVDLFNLNDVSDIINNGGVLMVIDENFDSIGDAFLIEDDKILAITGEGKVKHLVFTDTGKTVKSETEEKPAGEKDESIWDVFD